MAVTAKWFVQGAKHALSDVDWGTDTIKAMLVTSSYTPNQDTHEFKSDVTNEVAAGSGYTAGGITLTSKTTTTDAATNEVRLDAADITWTVPSGGSLSASYIVIYKDSGTASTSPLLGWGDFGQVMTSSASGTTAPFSITWDATGVLKAVCA